MQLFFISKLLLILLIRNSLSFLCSPTDLLWVCLCHAVLRLLTHLSVHLPAQMADSVRAELGLYPPQHPREHRSPPQAAGSVSSRRGSVNTYSFAPLTAMQPPN